MFKLHCLILVLAFVQCSLFAQRVFAQKVPIVTTKSITLTDASRNRLILVEAYSATSSSTAKPQSSLQRVVLLSAGYSGGDTTSHRAYSFIADALAQHGCLVLSVQHERPDDAPMAREGNLYELRKPIWERGVTNLLFVRESLRKKFTKHDFDHLVLLGHSNGGDISMLFATKYPNLVSDVITFDHRRMPIPRVNKPRILSLRSSDFEADAGVLPTPEEQKKFGMTITRLPNTKHGEMDNGGSPAQKQEIRELVQHFLFGGSGKE